MKRNRRLWLAIVMGVGLFFCFSGTNAFAGKVFGKLQFESGQTAREIDLEVMLDSHNSHVRSDYSGNFTISWPGNYEAVKIFFKGDQVFKGAVQDGDRITVTIKP